MYPDLISDFQERTASGMDYNRVNLLIAVLEKRTSLDFSNVDAYVNIAGGIKANEPGLDLALVLALVSSMKGVSIPEDLVCFGEVGLFRRSQSGKPCKRKNR